MNLGSGTEFEDYLAELFISQSYHVEITPSTGDYGAGLILLKTSSVSPYKPNATPASPLQKSSEVLSTSDIFNN